MGIRSSEGAARIVAVPDVRPDGGDTLRGSLRIGAPVEVEQLEVLVEGAAGTGDGDITGPPDEQDTHVFLHPIRGPVRQSKVNRQDGP